MHQQKRLFSFSLILSLLFLFSLSLIPATAAKPPLQCKSTLYPKFCHSILSAFRPSPSAHNPYGYAKFFVNQCLKHARKISQLIHLHQRWESGDGREVRAVEDCRELFMLNVELLESIAEDLRSVDDQSMTKEQVDGIRSRLSAIVTNHETCYDGLEEANSGILRPRGNGMEAAASLAPVMFKVRRLYSVSLGLVTQELNSNQKDNQHHHHHHHHHHHQHHHQDHGNRDNVESGSDNRLPPAPVAPVAPVNLYREPLVQFIKELKSTDCASSSKSCPREGGRIQSGMEGQGILIGDVVIVSKDGTGNFTTIGEAIAVSPNRTRREDGYFVIYVKQGVYEEYIDIKSNKWNIMLIGDGINATVITGNRNTKNKHFTTFYTATFAVSGDRFIAIDITFRNTAGPTNDQAVAVRNQADLSTFYRCSIEGYQDTLYAHSRRQFYRECDIYGTIDFIFGDAAAVFQNCNIFARKPLFGQADVITAQGREDPYHDSGYSIHNCTITAAPDLAASPNYARTYLGRPWKPYSTTVYMQSYIGGLIDPRGWLEMNGTEGLDTLYYGEYENYGPGADTSRRVQWPGFTSLSASDALKFTVDNLTTGSSWLPDTDIPYSAGLLES